MQAARIDVTNAQRRVAWQRALNADRRLQVVGLREIRSLAPDCLRLRKRCQRATRWNRGKWIEQSWIADNVLRFRISVESIGLQLHESAN